MTLILIVITIAVSVLCFRDRQLFNKLSLQPYRVIHHREWYRVITHLFVHGDYMHLIINMIVLLSFGLYLDKLFELYEQLGTVHSAYLCFGLLYFGGGIAASVYDLIKRHNNPSYASIGASGAVSATIFCAIFFNPWEKLYLMGIIPTPGIIFALLYVGYSQYMSRRGGDNINHNAHLYGALFGFFYPLLIKPSFWMIFWDNLKNAHF